MSTPSNSPDMLPPNDLPPPPPPHAPSDFGTTQEERQWAMFAHLSSLLGVVLTGGIGGFIGPLVIWLIKKDTMPFVNDQGKEALNFNITLAILGVGLFILTVITFFIAALLTVPVFIAAAIGWLVLTVIASIKASEGVAYRYPLTLRLIK